MVVGFGSEIQAARTRHIITPPTMIRRIMEAVILAAHTTETAAAVLTVVEDIIDYGSHIWSA